jgi:CheY-like chemotaxis protein
VQHEPSESLREGLTNQLAVVNRYQDTVRELLLKNQFVIKKSTPRGRVLLLAFIELVDLLDRSIAIDDDHLRIQLHDAGADILAKIREENKIPNVPIIVFSNLAEDKDIDRANKLGVNDFMVKSNFTLDELVAKLKSLIG